MSPSADVIARIVQEMRQWCADNSGHYHEDDIEEVVAKWADALASLGAPPQRNQGPFFQRDMARLFGLSDDASMDEIAAAGQQLYSEVVRLRASGASQRTAEEDK